MGLGIIAFARWSCAVTDTEQHRQCADVAAQLELGGAVLDVAQCILVGQTDCAGEGLIAREGVQEDGAEAPAAVKVIVKGVPDVPMVTVITPALGLAKVSSANSG